MFLVFLSVAIFAFLLLQFIKWRKFLKQVSNIPGIKGEIPFIGILFEFIGTNSNDLFHIVHSPKRVISCPSKVWVGPELVVVVYSPENIQKVFNSKKCLDKPDFFKFFKMTQGTILSNVDPWRHHRAILSPAFNMENLKTFVPFFDEISKKYLKAFDAKCDKEEFDIHDYMIPFFLEATFNYIFDLDIDLLKDEKSLKFAESLDE